MVQRVIAQNIPNCLKIPFFVLTANFDDPVYVTENMRCLLFQLNLRYVHQLRALGGGQLHGHSLVGVTEIQRTVVAQ